ncbi:cation transporter [Candidatus Woesearchaeota archaeon]|nr:cation transporter [Candidatus Woesearchaeota archaeon]
MLKNNIEKSLKVAIILTSIFFIVEVIGGLISGSLSLLGDAGHMLRDVFALLISLSALKLAKNIPTKKKTFGYHKLETFAAFINGILLIVISGWIFWEAYQRFFEPRPIESATMFFVAIIGLLVNIYVAFKLHGSHDLNVKSAFMHVLTDALSSAAVVFASIWIFFTGQYVVDPMLSILIASFILFSGFSITKESIFILLGFVPKELDFDSVVKDVEKVKGVEGVHNIHLWSLCPNINVMDAHVHTLEPDMGKLEHIKNEIKENLEKYNIKHTTLEFECEECKEIGKIKRIKH